MGSRTRKSSAGRKPTESLSKVQGEPKAAAGPQAIGTPTANRQGPKTDHGRDFLKMKW